MTGSVISDKERKRKMEFSRRSFLGGAAFAAAGMAAKGSAAAVPEKSGKVKFCVFADIHYKPGPWGFPNSSKEWLGRILERAKREKCDFIIHCGDMCHNPPEEIGRAHV